MWIGPHLSSPFINSVVHKISKTNVYRLSSELSNTDSKAEMERAQTQWLEINFCSLALIHFFFFRFKSDSWQNLILGSEHLLNITVRTGLFQMHYC